MATPKSIFSRNFVTIVNDTISAELQNQEVTTSERIAAILHETYDAEYVQDLKVLVLMIVRKSPDFVTVVGRGGGIMSRATKEARDKDVAAKAATRLAKLKARAEKQAEEMARLQAMITSAA